MLNAAAPWNPLQNIVIAEILVCPKAERRFCFASHRHRRPNLSLSLEWKASGHQPRGYIPAPVTLLGWFLFLFLKEKIQLGHL